MSLSSIFEDFSSTADSHRRSGPSQADPLAGYESGYQSGWDDAVKAHQESRTHLSTTLAQNLEQVEFTLIEAQGQLLLTLKPVIEEITNTLLPGLATEGLRNLILVEVETLLKTNLAADISIVVSEQDEPIVAVLLNSSKELSEVNLAAKDTLSEGQAYVSCATNKRKIDVVQAMSDIQKTIDSFLNQPELEHANAG